MFESFISPCEILPSLLVDLRFRVYDTISLSVSVKMVYGKMSVRKELPERRDRPCSIFTARITNLSSASLPTPITMSTTSSKFKVLAVEIRENMSCQALVDSCRFLTKGGELHTLINLNYLLPSYPPDIYHHIGKL